MKLRLPGSGPTCTFAAVGLLGMPAWAQVTLRIDVQPSGAQVFYSSPGATISADGRLVVFTSQSPLLVPGDSNGSWDVFVRDVPRRTTIRASVNSYGSEGNADSGLNDLPPPISADGRWVAFSSFASNLVAGDTNGTSDVFVRDLLHGSTHRVSIKTNGEEGNDRSLAPSISADGRFVAFSSWASNLVPGDANARADVFVRDRGNDTTIRVSVDSSGGEGDLDSSLGSISGDGRYVAFQSDATNLVAGDTNGWRDIFVHDLRSGVTSRVSVGYSGAQADQNSSNPSITEDGRFVAFESDATNLVPGDTNLVTDVFVRDRWNGTTELVSVDSNGAPGNGRSDHPSISPDGRYVLFASSATNLAPGDTNGAVDVFLRDRSTGSTSRVSVSYAGFGGNGASDNPALSRVISSDGRFVVFPSFADNFVSGDTNMLEDVFLADRSPDGFSSTCHPGLGGVASCPCSNPPSGPGRGCDNSAATGGASLAADGEAYVSMDHLVFTTSGESPTATSILLQGTSPLPNGITFGQGIRCFGGTLERLFVKQAVMGSITAPDFNGGDFPISLRSAALGDVIRSGQSRWYLVEYRDPIVLGGCPAGSTFNATQTGQVTWLP